MKLSFTFWAIFAVVSCSHNRQSKNLPFSMFSLAMPYSPSRNLYQIQDNPPYYLYDSGLINPSADLSSIVDLDEEETSDSGFPQSQSRTPGLIYPSISRASFQPQKRLFLNRRLPFWSPDRSTLTTVTVFSTVTAAVVTTCVPATQFALGAANTVCARRKRNVVEAAHLFDYPNELAPTLVQMMETTPIPNIEGFLERGHKQVVYESPIASSKQDEMVWRQPRAVTITFTTTATSTIYSSTFIKKALNLAPAGSLSCLPSGLTVC